MADLMIRIADVRATGHCVAGARRWCEANRLSFRDLLGDGIPASLVEAADSIGADVVAKTRLAADHG